MLIAISQRAINDRGGMSSLELSYISHFSRQGATLIAIPNDPLFTERYFKELKIERVILSGGGDIHPSLYGGGTSTIGGEAVRRDETEKKMLDIALAQDIPVLGICRGMEYINVYFGGKIQDVSKVTAALKHDATRHDVKISDASIVETLGKDVFEVNSYHHQVIIKDELSPQLTPFATAPDHTIEGFYHPEFAVAAVIWHPEREVEQHALNQCLVDAFFERKLFWSARNESQHEK
jgi:gamma-glutamyl-gamma-aminobutyrate hydrolase PuuD